jgi:alpha-L-rhamnosidase
MAQAATTVPVTDAGAVSAAELKCNGLVQPVLRISDAPTFGWMLQSSQPNERQSAYQVVVDGAWDSGQISSDQSFNIAYSGKSLAPCRQYTWRVRVWDSKHKPSTWSNAATFYTGPDEWSAKWIGLDEPGWHGLFASRWIWYPEGNPEQSAPVGTRYFRRTVSLPKDATVRAASLSVVADNTFELRINGQEVGESTTSVHLTKFDVTAHLHAGNNRINLAVINFGSGPNPAGLLVSLHIQLGDGSVVDLTTDQDWESSIDKQAWVASKVLGDYGMSPWGMVGLEGIPLPARYLRHEFNVRKQIVRATAYVCGLGFFDLSVNGQPISDDIMDPALSDYNKTCYYLAFDITTQVRAGKNALGVVLGNGRYFAPKGVLGADIYGFPKLIVQAKLDYSDGTSEMIDTDQTWRVTTDGPIRANNEYNGETYDARLAMPGWDTAGFDDSHWSPAELTKAPDGPLFPQTVEPMRITRILKPISISKAIDGSYIVDMGQNFYGTIRIKAEAPRGTEIRLTSAYSLKADGTLKTADNRNARCTDIYTFAGNGTETWNPRFKGQGFRHVRVTGFPGVLTVDNFEGLVIHTDVEPVGSFECSNELVNHIHSNLCWGARMFLRSAPLDPDRDERQAWMGDPAKDSESEAYNWDVSCFYRKWMVDVQQSQRPDGSIPSVAMYWDMGDGVEWPAVFTIIPDWFIDFYGDENVARIHYDAMKKWVLAMRRHERPDGTLTATSYGDWCDTYTMGGKIDDYGHTPRDLISSAYQYHNYRIIQRLAKLFGKPDDEKTFSDLSSNMKRAFNRRFFDPKTNVYFGDTQCAYLLPLTFGLVPDDHREAVVNKLVDDILIKHNGHLSVGLVGMQWLMQTLTDVGRPDVAWIIATQTTSPSWGYMVSKGATTIWERWDYETRDPGMNSEALLIQAGNLDAWFYQTVAGIRPGSPGFKHILIKPNPLGDLTWVKCHFDCPYGRIESNWQRNDHQLVMDVTVPVNTTATIVIPGKNGTTHEVESGHYRYISNDAF